jgi:hypothetical protein
MSEPEITQDDQDVEGHGAVKNVREAPAASSADEAAPLDDGDDVEGHGTVKNRA